MSKPDFLFFLPRPGHPRCQNPGLQLRWRWGWIKGMVFRPYWKIRAAFFGTRLKIGKRVSLQGALIARGPGRVIVGDDCIISDRCTPFTHSSTAIIRIGCRVYLNGTRFGCAERIDVGDDCILADARIIDTDFHSVHESRNTAHAPQTETRAVKIGKNVWIAAGSAVLKGVEIGQDSVIGYGSVVSTSVPAGRIFAGNPAKDLGAVQKLGPQSLK